MPETKTKWGAVMNFDEAIHLIRIGAHGFKFYNHRKEVFMVNRLDDGSIRIEHQSEFKKEDDKA